MNVINLVQYALESQGFDGLYVSGICACKKDDLSHGDCLDASCQSGYLSQHSIRPDYWAIGPKQGATDEEIEQTIQECS